MLDEQFSPGQIIDNQFKLLKKLGEGGMGQVFLAEQLEIERLVVIKFIHLHLLGKPSVIERFRREAKLLSRIQHPNVVNLYTIGQINNGAPFLVMEYIDGQPLSLSLRELHTFPPSRALLIASQIASALAEAHAHNIVHRDLKPDNIMLTRTADGVERIKLLDFGIARVIASAIEDDSALTHTGAIMGTPRYMSPEQINNEPIDGRADIYALGLILYEMLSGHHPIRAHTPMQFMMGHMSQDISPVSTLSASPLPPFIDALLYKTLARDRDHRFPSALALQNAITETLPLLPSFPSHASLSPQVTIPPSTDPENLSTPLPTDPTLSSNLSESFPPLPSSPLNQPPSPPHPLPKPPSATPSAPQTHRLSLPFSDTPPPQQKISTKFNLLYIAVPTLILLTATLIWWRMSTDDDPKVLSDSSPRTPVSQNHTAHDADVMDVDLSISHVQTNNSITPQDPPPSPLVIPPPNPSSAAGRVLRQFKIAKTPPPLPILTPQIPPTTPPQIPTTPPQIPAFPTYPALTDIPPATLEEMRASKRINFSPVWTSTPKPTLESLLPEAQHLAKLLLDDATLTHISAASTLPPFGSPHIGTSLEPLFTFQFFSPRISTPSAAFPANTRRPCLAIISYAPSSAYAAIQDHPDCTHLPARPPRCSSAQIWARAIRDGAPKSNAAAHLQFLHNPDLGGPSWIFSSANLSLTYPDDCPAPPKSP